MATIRTDDVIANHPLYASMREQLPGVPEDKTAEITLRALQNGILGPDRLQRAQVHDERIVAVGTVPGFGAMVGLNTPAPPIAELNAQYAALGKGATVAQAPAQTRAPASTPTPAPAPTSSPAPAPAPAPADSVTAPTVNVNVGRALDADEQRAVDALNASIRDVTRTINGIPNEARMTLADGRTVSGEELRDMWSKTQFTLHHTGYNEYRNKSARGEADYNGGDPQIGYNIDNLTKYSRVPGGMNYLVLHEIGHMTVAGRETNTDVHRDDTLTHEENETNERLANDVARGIAHRGGLSILPATGPTAPTQGGYSADIPSFDTPAPPQPGDEGPQKGEGAPAPRR
ncbi:hypothetical protein [Lysobacter sp. CA199]|uniref:hypothetical protein n=1 Tax=Lysobacter sp. CA199 TaxID=3455608 RepID=UPI003F8D3A7F